MIVCWPISISVWSWADGIRSGWFVRSVNRFLSHYIDFLLPISHRGYVSEDFMWPLLVIVSVPLCSLLSCFLDVSEVIVVQNRFSVTSVKPFYVAVLCRVARLCVPYLCILLLVSLLEILGEEFRSVVTSNVLGLSPQPDEFLYRLYHSSGREGNGIFPLFLLIRIRAVYVHYAAHPSDADIIFFHHPDGQKLLYLGL